MDQIIVYTLHISLIKDNYDYLLSIIDKYRIDKALKYKQEKDVLLSLGAGYLIKRYLPKEEIKYQENGKPYLDNGPYFNISHSGDYAALAIHPSRDVGVDIELINSSKENTVRFVLKDEENSISDIETLFKLWSNKESIVKCISTGIQDMKNVSGLPLEGNRNINGVDYFVKALVYDNHSLSLTLKGSEPFEIKLSPVQIR